MWPNRTLAVVSQERLQVSVGPLAFRFQRNVRLDRHRVRVSPVRNYEVFSIVIFLYICLDYGHSMIIRSFMKTLSVCAVVLAFSFSSAFGGTWNPDERLLNAVCQVESSGGRYLYGDDGVSLGHFQMQKAAWADVSAWRKNRNLPAYNYRPHVLDPRISRIYAAGYLTIIHDRLQGHYKREPSASELYAAYNMGMSNFRKCDYALANVNKVTLGKCQKIEAMLK